MLEKIMNKIDKIMIFKISIVINASKNHEQNKINMSKRIVPINAWIKS